MKINRLEAIRHHLYTSGETSIQALAEAIGASLATVRRDLQILEQQGVISRTHGTARIANGVDIEVAFEVRENQHIIIHRPETAWSPNYPGTAQERPYHLMTQDRFFFRGPRTEKQKDGAEVPVIWTITWERLK